MNRIVSILSKDEVVFLISVILLYPWFFSLLECGVKVVVIRRGKESMAVKSTI